MSRQLRVAVVGAGPAGIYAADILTKSEVDVTVDILDRDPTPFGLIRYGVAPDHRASRRSSRRSSASCPTTTSASSATSTTAPTSS